MHKNTQKLPLAGIRVIDYSHFLAGPHMSRCLSAMGTEWPMAWACWWSRRPRRLRGGAACGRLPVR